LAARSRAASITTLARIAPKQHLGPDLQPRPANLSVTLAAMPPAVSRLRKISDASRKSASFSGIYEIGKRKFIRS
jgi:hypothetical protein